MKTFLKAVFVILIASSMVITPSCSKKNQSFNHQARKNASASSYDPVSRKHYPPRKKYIVPGKKKTILGHEKPLK